jgi:hypothetical protein
MRHSGEFRLLALFLAVALGLSLAACSGRPQTVGSGSATSSVTEETTASAGEVTLSVGKSQYAPHDTIEVTVHNGLATSIFAQDSHSDCTLMTLLRSVNGSWQAQGSCVGMAPTRHILEIRPGAVMVQLLAPGQDDSSEPLWPSGTYQVTFAYVSSPTQGFGQSTEIHSASFVVV